MRFLQRDLKRFKLYHYTVDTDDDGVLVTDDYGEVIRGLPAVPDFEFYGNIQPFSEKSDPKAYGVELRYAYVVYTQFGPDFREGDVIVTGGVRYEIKVIQRWNYILRLVVEEVFDRD